MMRPITSVLAAFTLVVATAVLASDPHEPATLVPMDRDTLRGELSASEGRVILVNLWATWCTPCLREIPDLLALEADLPAGDFRLLAISMDDAYSEAWVTEFKAKHFPTLVSFINAELDIDTLVSVIDPLWNETCPPVTSSIATARRCKKYRTKNPSHFSGSS